MKKIIFASQTFSREIWTKDEKEAWKFSKWSFLADGTCLRWMWAKNEKKTDGRDLSKIYQGMRKRWERRENEPFCRGELFPRPPGAGPVKNHRASVAPATNMCEEEWQLRGICANVLCSKKINKMSNFNDFGNTIFLRQRVEKQLSCSSSRYVWENSRFSQKKYKTCLENIRHIHM